MQQQKYLLPIAAIIFGGTIGAITYNILWHRTIEDVIVTSIGTTQVYFLEENKIEFEVLPKITVTHFEDCLQSYELNRKNIKVGDKIQRISYRSPLFGECKVLTEIVQEK